MREGTKRKICWENRLAVGGWLQRKAGDRKEVYVVFADMQGWGDTGKHPEGAVGHK